MTINFDYSKQINYSSKFIKKNTLLIIKFFKKQINQIFLLISLYDSYYIIILLL